MKRFRLLMVCLAMAVATTMAVAQNDTGNNPAPSQNDNAQMDHGRHGRPGMRAQDRNFWQSLNLTQDQRDKMRPILQQQREQMRQVFQDQSLSREQRIQKMQQIRENTSSQIRALLTPDQQQKFDAHEKEMKQRMQERMQQRQNGSSPDDSSHH